jgi:hypothetical protein
MKWIKLFENFSDEIVENNKMANDIVEDIKTISYLLEDEGFELKYSFRSETGSSFEVDEYNKLVLTRISVRFGAKPVKIGRIIVKVIGNSIVDPRTFQTVLRESDIKMIDRYIDLLKEHLDYIDPENITKQISLMGNMNIIIKL